ncbi:hypothetical protein PE36_00115 [Moritella sp. PE36]|nr:hypothetical protein PE36_00115 [Moritella sp. PE36]
MSHQLEVTHIKTGQVLTIAKWLYERDPNKYEVIGQGIINKAMHIDKPKRKRKTVE